MARVLISMSDEFLNKVDSIASTEQRTRSELIREALRSYLRKSKMSNIKNAEENADRAAANVLWVVFAILFFVSSLVIGILLFVRRKEERADGEESEESDSQQ